MFGLVPMFRKLNVLKSLPNKWSWSMTKTAACYIYCGQLCKVSVSHGCVVATLKIQPQLIIDKIVCQKIFNPKKASATPDQSFKPLVKSLTALLHFLHLSPLLQQYLFIYPPECDNPATYIHIYILLPLSLYQRLKPNLWKGKILFFSPNFPRHIYIVVPVIKQWSDNFISFSLGFLLLLYGYVYA